jgi:hypothetical protein
MRNFGFAKTEFDGTEYEYNVPQTLPLPDEFSYMNNLPSVINQGNDPICVPCSISSYINWFKNMEDGIVENNDVDLLEIFNNRINQDSNDGMSFKEAFKFLKNEGVSYKDGIFKIKQYATITNLYALKYAIYMNGPCLGALPVYNFENEFWVKDYQDELQGFHAISIIGYTKDGFIIRNSWGKSYGKDGYFLLKNENINSFLELWTIIS